MANLSLPPSLSAGLGNFRHKSINHAHFTFHFSFLHSSSLFGFRSDTWTRRARSPPFETPPYRLFERARAQQLRIMTHPGKLAVVVMPSVIKSMAKVFILVSSGGPPPVPQHRHHHQDTIRKISAPGDFTENRFWRSMMDSAFTLELPISVLIIRTTEAVY